MNSGALLVAYPPDGNAAVGGLGIGFYGEKFLPAEFCLITIVDRVAVVICDLVAYLAVVAKHLT